MTDSSIEIIRQLVAWGPVAGIQHRNQLAENASPRSVSAR